MSRTIVLNVCPCDDFCEITQPMRWSQATSSGQFTQYFSMSRAASKSTSLARLSAAIMRTRLSTGVRMFPCSSVIGALDLPVAFVVPSAPEPWGFDGGGGGLWTVALTMDSGTASMCPVGASSNSWSRMIHFWRMGGIFDHSARASAILALQSRSLSEHCFAAAGLPRSFQFRCFVRSVAEKLSKVVPAIVARLVHAGVEHAVRALEQDEPLRVEDPVLELPRRLVVRGPGDRAEALRREHERLQAV